MSTDLNKIKNNIAKIEKIVEKKGKRGYYLIDGDSVKLIGKGNEFKYLENEMLEKINGKSQYIKNFIYRVDVHINPKFIGKDDIIVGPVSLKIKEFQITKNFKLKFEEDFKIGSLIYTNADIKNGKFHFTDIKDIIYKIYDKKIDIISVGIRAIDVLEE